MKVRTQTFSALAAWVVRACAHLQKKGYVCSRRAASQLIIHGDVQQQ